MADVEQSLSVAEKSQDVDKNTSQVRILWTSTQDADSFNLNTRTAKYYVSINGGAEEEYSVNYTLPAGATKTILDKTITVSHKSDGTATIRVRTWMDTKISVGVVEKDSGVVTLPPIARASKITSFSPTTAKVGSSLKVNWKPASASFRYKLKFALGTWSYTTDAIYPKTTTATYHEYTIPYAVAEQLTDNPPSGKMTVALYTYSNSACTNQVGSADVKEITATVPKNSTTLPSASMTVTAVSTITNESFAGMYIQGKSKVKVELSGSGKLGATIASKSIKINGKTYKSGDTSDLLTTYGSVEIVGTVTDSRGYKKEVTKTITMIPYSKPTITDVEAYRCDVNGNAADGGTYLKIKATRVYHAVKSGTEHKNFCKIQYRYKSGSGSYSSWTTIMDENASGNKVETGSLLNGGLKAENTYTVQIRVIDTIGESSSTTVQIPTDKVYCHRNGAKNSFAFGGYADEENAFIIAEGIAFKVKSEEWKLLGLAQHVSLPSNEHGHNGPNCYYRVVNGNHVYVAVNCKFSFAGDPVTISDKAIPSEYRPTRNVYAICAAEGRYVARVLVNKEGYVRVDRVQDLASGSPTTTAEINWMDGYIDYFV